MRVIVVTQRNDLQDLRTRLGRAPSSALDDIERLNPHVDFRRIEPGTVLLVPDVPGVPGTRPNEGSIQGQAFDELRTLVSGALQGASSRVRSGHQTLAEQGKEVSAILKTAAVKRAVEADPGLQPQLDAAAAVFKQDTAQAKTVDETMKTMKARVDEELAALAKLLG